MKHDLIIGDYSLPEFENIKHWIVQEKIDGTRKFYGILNVGWIVNIRANKEKDSNVI